MAYYYEMMQLSVKLL